VSAFLVIRDAPPSLREAQAFVGGYVQIVRLRNGDQLLMNEGTNLKRGAPANPEAAAHATASGGAKAGAHGGPDLSYLLGPVMCLRGEARWSINYLDQISQERHPGRVGAEELESIRERDERTEGAA